MENTGGSISAYGSHVYGGYFCPICGDWLDIFEQDYHKCHQLETQVVYAGFSPDNEIIDKLNKIIELLEKLNE